ncbi:MAG: hypothetical protein ACYC63_12485 [Armatimonadota bacterium]
MAIVEQENPERLEWRVWPAAQRPGLSIGVALLVLALSLGAMWSFGSGWYAFITLAVLTLSLAPHYFPSTNRLDEQTVMVNGPGKRVERPWEAFRVAVELPDRVVLSPLSKVDGWIARRRSVTLMFCDNKEEVMAVIGRHVDVR